ncbi:N-succinylarginine dihydrolase [Thalassoglobus neptunius]|uniref:N-succinylarginine dihydrolase n=1 Tax=Thalassoglobus neptunius TaxID=1938619 RepID=A0A5C5WCW1_9PLAN|nr:N-succinylarginine dihydrolase [Thalassoglobus neptunius]TWT47915.1 N-succinylarginine dihydrolase [Thalassoglobus neptunius]
MNEAAVAVELNLDGLVGPTHHYGGLAPGNIASQSHRYQVSYSKRAALEGLRKMRRLAELSIPQGVLPPHYRPDIDALRVFGLTGTDEEVLAQALQEHPDLLSSVSSASAMWTANAATVSPSADTQDGRVHFTPANLQSTPHRRLETQFTTTVLRTIFNNSQHFVIHDPLPATEEFSDEGAANHMRVSSEYGQRGLEVFVYGRSPELPQSQLPGKFPARQTRAACEAIARNHLLNPDWVSVVQQTPRAIDAGVFHNDVIAVANERSLFCHSAAFVQQSNLIDEWKSLLPGMRVIEVSEDRLSLEETVGTYLFNSQLVTLKTGEMLLLCPEECRKSESVMEVLDELRQDSALNLRIEFVDLRQSMQNGGGPACLRLRVVLTERELQAMSPSIRLTPELASTLEHWVNRHYRDELTLPDLADPKLLDEVQAALDELTGILNLGAIYSFQK